MTLSARGALECGDLRNRRTCTPHDAPVLYAPAGRELCAGKHMSMPGRQLSLYEWLPIGKLLQPGPYTGPNCTKTHDQSEAKHWKGPRSCPETLSVHPPRSSFTQTNWRSCPVSSREDPIGLPYRSAPTPFTRSQRSPRPHPPTPPHRQPSGAAK